MAKNENPNQVALVIEELTDQVEETVLKECAAISPRGGVLGGMETGCQRCKIQEESIYYEKKSHDDFYPIVGVNTFLNPHHSSVAGEIELARSTDEEMQSLFKRLRDIRRAMARTQRSGSTACARR